MGTREVYEAKLRNGNLHHDPTLNPGVGTPRCPRCLSRIDSSFRGGDWAITPDLHNIAAIFGSGFGAIPSTYYGFKSGVSYVQNHVKGPKWLQFLVGAPSLMLFTAGSAAFGGYALPRFTQLTVTSYYAASSGSHYGISQLTRQIEEAHISKPQQKRH